MRCPECGRSDAIRSDWLRGTGRFICSACSCRGHIVVGNQFVRDDDSVSVNPTATCWAIPIEESSILCSRCGPTHVRSVWDEPSVCRFACVQCGALGTVLFEPLRFVFDELEKTI